MAVAAVISVSEPSYVLTINCGSSSVKTGVFSINRGGIEEIAAASYKIGTSRGASTSAISVVTAIRDLVTGAGVSQLSAIGHRFVHGGPNRLAPCPIDQAVLREIRNAARYAPLHNEFALAVLDAAVQTFIGPTHYASFDTAFHATMPECAKRLPIPLKFHEQGVFRYGFHGLVCSSVVRQFGANLPERLIVAHLGAGASITAIRGGASQDTSMGMTPSGGLIMGTRTGDLDPGVFAYMARDPSVSLEALADLTDRQSGLHAISGHSSDMIEIRSHVESDLMAKLALAMFCNSARKHIAAMISVLNGVDAIVFTGGIGENDWATRAEVCSGLVWAGVTLDDMRNRTSEGTISASASKIAVHVFRANENAEIAHDAARMLERSHASVAWQ